MDNLHNLDAVAQAALVASGEVSPLELVDAAIARIEKLDPHVRALVARQFDQARARARGPLPDGPFRGVPFLLKDLGGGAERGAPLTYGCRMLASHLAGHDSTLVARFRAAGLVFLGRTNTPEFGIPPTTESALFGPTRNPWNLNRSTGGSSGGAAAAVAARMVPFAHASDSGGSIRIPASACGVFGLKPTRGRIPTGPRLGESIAGLTSELCCSISVRDSAALLDAVAGADLGASYAAPAQPPSFRDTVQSPPPRLRVGVQRTPPNGAAVHPECMAALESAIGLCRDLGHEVVEESPVIQDLSQVQEAFGQVYMVKAAVEVQMAEQLAGHPVRDQDIEPLTEVLARMGRAVSATDYVNATRVLQRATRDVAGFFETHDVLLSPTMAQPPVAIGELAYPAADPAPDFIKAARYTAFTPLFNATGQPAMNVPLHWSTDGMPIGVQFAGRFGDEATLLRLAAQLEQARPWANRLPPLLA